MKWLIDKILEVWHARTDLRVLVHEAYFQKNNKPFYFIKIINNSPNKVLTITHVWVKENKDVPILSNPLPRKLNVSDIWETWIEKRLVSDHENIFKNVRVMLSNGRTYKSKMNVSVPPIGYVAR
jgi:hypothetical protein